MDEAVTYVAEACGMCSGVRVIEPIVRAATTDRAALGGGCENAHHHVLTLDETFDIIGRSLRYQPDHDGHQHREGTRVWAQLSGRPWSQDCPGHCSDWTLGVWEPAPSYSHYILEPDENWNAHGGFTVMRVEHSQEDRLTVVGRANEPVRLGDTYTRCTSDGRLAPPDDISLTVVEIHQFEGASVDSLDAGDAGHLALAGQGHELVKGISSGARVYKPAGG